MPDTQSVIEEVLLARAAALSRKDAEAAAAYLGDEPVSFELAPPLQVRGSDSAGLQAWFDSWDGDIELNYAQMHIRHDEEIAYARFLSHMAGRRTDGQQVDLWYRSTICLERAEETWKIVHEHHSVPFLMDGSNLAALELRP